MNIFSHRFTARIFLAATLLGAPLSAAAQQNDSVLVISNNVASVAMPIEPVAITRSGLSVASRDLQHTGGLSEELTFATVISSRRPERRAIALPFAQLRPEQGETPNTSPRRVEGAASIGRSTVNRAPARITPRRQTRIAPRTAPVQSTPAFAAPTYLLGVFR